MNKIIYVLMFLSIFVPSCFSREPTLAKLQKVYSNGMQKFKLSQYEFVCKAYGIITVDELYAQAKQGSICRDSIDEFYKQNLRLKLFSASLLQENQYYHVRFKERRCIVYAKGLNTLSELLLSNGLALRQSVFKDEEFEYSFFRAQANAKENNLGMYKNKIKSKCMTELYEIGQKKEKKI